MENWHKFRNDLEGIPSDYDGGNMFAANVMAALGFYLKSGTLVFFNIVFVEIIFKLRYDYVLFLLYVHIFL
jgi:hypothetical protein